MLVDGVGSPQTHGTYPGDVVLPYTSTLEVVRPDQVSASKEGHACHGE